MYRIYTEVASLFGVIERDSVFSLWDPQFLFNLIQLKESWNQLKSPKKIPSLVGEFE